MNFVAPISAVILFIMLLCRTKHIVPIGIIVGVVLNMMGYYQSEMIDTGILLTMFSIGTHFDTKLLLNNLRTVFLIVVATLISAISIAFSIKSFFVIEIKKACILGILFSLSSSIVCEQILLSGNRIITKYGNIALLGTIIQDIIGIILIIFLRISTCKKAGIYKATLNHIIFFIGVIVIYSAYSKFRHSLSKLQSDDDQRFTDIMVAISIGLFLLAETLEHYFISKEVIFFLAGTFFKEFYYNFIDTISSFQKYFLIYTFVISGNCIQGIHLYDKNRGLIEFFIVIHIIKFLLFYMFLAASKQRTIDAIRTSILLMPCSELLFFIVDSLELEPFAKTIAITVTFSSMILTKVAFEHVNSLFEYHQFQTIGISLQAAKAFVHTEAKYVIVIGINEYIDNILEKLGEKGIQTAVIDKNIDKVVKAQNNQYFYMDASIKDVYTIFKPKNILAVVLVNMSVSNARQILQRINSIDKDIIIYTLCYRENLDQISKHFCIPVIVQTKNISSSYTQVAQEICKISMTEKN